MKIPYYFKTIAARVGVSYQRAGVVRLAERFGAGMAFVVLLADVAGRVIGEAHMPGALKDLSAYAVGGALYTGWHLWPTKVVKKLLHGRDTGISIQLEDAFRLGGTLVVPVNCHFDNRLGGRVTNAPSLQGRLVKDLYDGKTDHLDAEIRANLAQQGIAPDCEGAYPLGTAAHIVHKNRHFYLVATSFRGEHGRVSGTAQDVDLALASLWTHLRTAGHATDNLVVPLIGTGQGKTIRSREATAQATIRSFLASCVESKWCSHLTLAIWPEDVLKYGIRIDRLEHFLESAAESMHVASADPQPNPRSPSKEI